MNQSTGQPVNDKLGRLGKPGKVAKKKIVQIAPNFGEKFANRLL